MAPQISLTYFGMRGRVEPTRLALHIADIPFEDKRITHSEWPALKPKTKLGQLPIMHVDGEV